MNVRSYITVFTAVAFVAVNQGFTQTACEQSCFTQFPGDQIWLVSARDVDFCATPGTDQLKCQKFCNGQWVESSFCDLSNSQQCRSVVYVHGYQTDLKSARSRGLRVYQNVYAHRPESEPVRYIIWAWKSERENRRPIKDFDMKSHRAVALADIFATTMNNLGPIPPVVIGYSLGAQVVVSAFVQSTLYTGPPVRLVIVAAANDCGFASCPNQFSNCGNIEQSIIFCNESDRAIRASRLICKVKYGANFQTFEDLALQNDCSLGAINVVDISDVASKRHSILRYTSLPVVQAIIQQLLSSKSILQPEVSRESVPVD